MGVGWPNVRTWPPPLVHADATESASGLVVIVGRNAGPQQRPLPNREWNRFMGATQAIVKQFSDEIVADNPGKGSWVGRPEDNLVLIGVRHAAAGSPPPDLTSGLAQLACAFEQQAIACISGPLMLIEAARQVELQRSRLIEATRLSNQRGAR